MNEENYILKKLQSATVYSFKDKKNNIDYEIAYMLDRTQSMFTYAGLPDTIPARMLELYIQMNGNACIAQDPKTGKLYAFTGGLGGTPDAYYMPTEYIVANPALHLSKSYKIDVDCVVIPNDSFYMGLLPMFKKFATGKVENELSINVAMINARIATLISSGNDETRKSAETYLKRIEDGETGVIADSDILGQLQAVPYGTTGSHTLTDLIELEQYIKASWFNALGLNSNYNMKRESINAGESQLNDDALLPLVDNMLSQRKLGVEKVNAMFGTAISVDLASSWKDNQQEVDLKHEEMQAEGEGPNTSPADDGTANNTDDNGGDTNV